jgi:hypothetical protein|nr:MAG TPA: major tail protein [Caudoviricetes sp.]
MSNERESPRIKGQKLGFQINGKPVWPDMSEAELSPSSDDSFATFGSILAGGTPMQLKVSGIVSTAAASLWRLLFDNVGRELPFIFAPNGNDTPTNDQPHYIGRVTIKQPPNLPVKINEVSSFDLEMPVVEWSQKVSNG